MQRFKSLEKTTLFATILFGILAVVAIGASAPSPAEASAAPPAASASLPPVSVPTVTYHLSTGEGPAHDDETVAVTRAPLTPLSPQKLKRVLRNVGFKGVARKTAWAIAMRESRGIPDIVSEPNWNGTRDHGLFQLNDVHRANHDFSRVLTAKGNAQIAYTLSAGGTDFSAWGVGTTGWAGELYRTQPEFWNYLQTELSNWMAQYPKRLTNGV